MLVNFVTDIKTIHDIIRIKKLDAAVYNDDELLKEAGEKKERLQAEWNRNQPVVTRLFNDIFPGLNKNDYRITVYAFPETITIGACNCETRAILYGYPDEYENFPTVIISHEITHILIYAFRKNNTISRVTDEMVAFLTAECELRRRLNNQPYFEQTTSAPLTDFHATAFEKAKQNVDIWNDYLAFHEKNIEALLTKLERTVDSDDKSHYNKVKLKDFLQ